MLAASTATQLEKSGFEYKSSTPEVGEMPEHCTTLCVETTVGRALLSELMPRGLSFSLVNQTLNKKSITGLINACYRRVGLKETVIFADQLMYAGFSYATKAGISIGVEDMVVPEEKKAILDQAEVQVKEIEQQYGSGLPPAPVKPQ